jgi:cytochrome c oxidase subunit 5b
VTGFKRLRLLGQLNGVDVFNIGPLLITKLGTIADPTLVPAYVRGGF